MNKYIFLLLILIPCVLLAESDGEAGFKMLTIDTGASNSALAGAGAYLPGDAFAFMINPSATLFHRGRTVSAAQNFWIFETSLTSLGYAYSNGKQAFGLGFRQLDYGKFTFRDDTGENIGEFHPLDLVLTTNFGYRVTPDHYLGMNLSILYEKIHNASTLGTAFDLGYTYLPPLKNLKIGAALKNFGFTTKMNNEKINLPLTGEMYLSHDYSLGITDLNSRIKVFKINDDKQVKAGIGLNARFYEKFTLRVGYRFNYDAQDFSAGIGINFKRFQLDYAYLPFDYEINDVHMIGLSYRL